MSRHPELVISDLFDSDGLGSTLINVNDMIQMPHVSPLWILPADTICIKEYCIKVDFGDVEELLGSHDSERTPVIRVQDRAKVMDLKLDRVSMIGKPEGQLLNVV